jgi:mannose-6-phosphate isomerase-like protein (cupin superfamily)
MQGLQENISVEDVQTWMNEESLLTKNKRSYQGFDITDAIDGGADPDREVSLVRLKDSEKYPQHVHRESDALFVVTAGSAILLSGESRRPVQTGDWIPVPRGMPHGFELTNGGYLEFVSVQSPPIKNRVTGEEDLELVDFV